MRDKNISWKNVLLMCAATSAVTGATSVLASDQIGTVTDIQGDVKLFTHPSKTLQKTDGVHVLFEGEYYLVGQAKPGQKLEHGNILRATPGAKARVIYNNGDQFMVGPGTAFRVFWDKDSPSANTRIELAYGKVRGVVEKGGPRSHLQIRTKTATMGVRGTDFFIADDGADGGTEVSIIRGAVKVEPKAPQAKPIEVTSGFSASVAPPVASVADGEKKSAPIVNPVVELRKTTQEELVGIQKSSVIEKKKDQPESPQIAELEKKALATTLKDIKTHDPKLYAQIESGKIKSIGPEWPSREGTDCRSATCT